MAHSQHPFFLTVNGRALSATCFLPTTVCGAALFIPPFVEERKGALPVFVRTARSLAEQNIASLLFDFSGCGDSEGAFEEMPPEFFDADCEAAWAWLKKAFPSVPCACLGVRTGALLAIRLSSVHPEVAALVLWAPVSGPDFVRQLLQRRMVNDMVAYGKAQESRTSLEARLQQGGTVDLDGYAFSGAFYAWLQKLVPQAAHVPVCVSFGGHDAKTANACARETTGASVLTLRYPPFWNTVGHVDLTPLITATAEWLVQRLAGLPSLAAALPPLSAKSSFSEFISPENSVSPRMATDMPRGTPKAGVMFLHGWSGDRTGPHRLFARFARALAQDGYLCMRPDFTGRGLSDGDASVASIAQMSEDAQATFDTLRKRLSPGTPIIVVAICSGCKVAITLAARNQEISKLLLWSAESMGDLRNPATGFRKTVTMLITYARKLSRPETWKKILSGKIQTGLVTQALVKQETRSTAEAEWENGILNRFQTYRHPICFVFGGSDPDANGSHRAYALYCRKNGIPSVAHTIAHAGHSYYSEPWTQALIGISRTFLSEH